MLVPSLGAPGEDRRREHRRVVERPVGREERSAVGGIKALPGERAAKISRRADIVADLIAKTVAAGVVNAEQAASVGIWFVSVKKVPNGPAKLGFGFSAETAIDMP